MFPKVGDRIVLTGRAIIMNGSGLRYPAGSIASVISRTNLGHFRLRMADGFSPPRDYMWDGIWFKEYTSNERKCSAPRCGKMNDATATKCWWCECYLVRPKGVF
jgi:hypothetical protein